MKLRTEVMSQAGPLFSSKYQATVGNPNASATLVEFFDYNCHYCKGALPDIAKLMTRISHRGRGVARSLMLEAERIAARRGRTLLVLDTAEEDGAAGVYDKLGYQRVGIIPDFALKPHGGLTGTIVYYKRLDPVG